MLTPVDIENKEFTRAFRGYEVEEVEDFRRTLVNDYEKLYRENGELKEKNAILNESIGNYKGMEETMQNAILVAQRTAEDIKQNAYERSETIIKDAERRAAEAIDKANRSISNLEKSYHAMQREMNGFKAKMSALLSTYMQLLQDLPEQAVSSAFAEVVAASAPAEPAPAPAPFAEPAPQTEEVSTVCEDTNIYSKPLVAEKPATEDTMPVPAAPAVQNEAASFQTERKINPVVEELMRKKHEEEAQKSAFDPAVSVTKETVPSDSGAVSEIDLNNLKAYDVFADDTL